MFLQALAGFLSHGNMINIHIKMSPVTCSSFLVSDAMPFSALITAYAAFVDMALDQIGIIFCERRRSLETQESLKDIGIVEGSVLLVKLRLTG